MAKKHVPVNIGEDAYKKVQEYSKLTGVPITRIAAEAIDDWINTIGAARLESIQHAANIGRAQVIEINATQAAPLVQETSGANA